jgi:drug/metabolite transporter (DMT)-like permease
MGSLTFSGARFTIGLLSLLPVLFVLERRRGAPGERKKTLLYGALAGAILFVASVLQQYGIALTQSAGKAGFITGLYTVLVPLFSIALGKKPTVLTGLGALSAFAGLYFLSMPNGLEPPQPGDIVLFAGAIFWTFHIMVVDNLASRVRPLRFSVVQFAMCAALSWAGVALVLFLCGKSPAVYAYLREAEAVAAAAGVHAKMLENFTLQNLRDGMVPLLYCGVLSVGVAYTLQIVGQRRVEPSKAAIIFSLETVFSAVGGYLFLREQLGWKGYLGGALMFLGIVLSQVNPKKKSAALLSSA